MSIHKLSAGSGYDYLTRQVAVHDATDKGHTGLASYYADKGETPGRWVGSGMAGIDGLDVGYEVTANQMANLFGVGYHPLAQQRWANVDGPDVTDTELRAAMRLGAPFRIYPAHATPFQVEVATRIAALSTALRTATGGEVSLQDRARIRTEVAVEVFRAAHGRDPADAREVAATVAKHTRPRTNAVSGYDLTFSPVKSVSTLWAVADPATAAAIERAHHAAVTDALTFLERHALFTRLGTDGVRQVEVRGLVAASFTHRDSRAGDPDLHTHVAVANKVQTLASHRGDGADGTPDGGGRWLSIDGRILFQAVVTASETYNTALERHLHHDLGLHFATRTDQSDQPARPDQRAGQDRQHGGYDGSRKRPVREVVGVDDRLNQAWSSRRTAIVARQGDLARAFQRDHGRPPTPIEAIQLAQQATLETRDRKKHPRSLTQQRTTWRAQAARVLGSEHAIEQMVHTALHPGQSPTATTGVTTRLDTSWLDTTAAGVVAAVEARRSTWQVWHVRAEAHRALRSSPDLTLTPVQAEQVVDLLVDAALERHSVALTARDHPDSDRARGIREPDPLRRRDGSSVYTVAGTQQYTSTRILAAEARLLATAGRTDGRTATTADVDLALLEAAAHGVTLNPGQADLVRQMATSGARLQLAIAPAGSGKTTALHALTSAWTTSGGSVVGLAPSAAAAAVLHDHLHPTSDRSATGTTTDTLAKLVWSIGQLHLDQHATTHTPSSPGAGRVPQWVRRIRPGTLVVIDEAGMADTLSLDTAVAFVTARGGSVRLIGDDQQLAAIGAGGILRDLAATHGAVRLDELLRFTTPGEGAASLALRDGRPEALGFYLDRHRVHVGDPTTSLDDVLTAWADDRAQGLDALMLAPTRDLVADLNHRARTHRL
ncbi:MAG: relaxase domain-containing protein, partial [Actinomycetota bacterium]|nr:relaxase domain-containing protein [Actinomycetota bacterium]